MIKNVQVREWMTDKVISVTSDTLISEAHTVMKEYDIRRLPVIDNGKLKGIISLGDVREASPSGATTLSIWELNYLWSQIKVKDIMTKKVLTVNADDPLIDAAQLMMDKKISGLPVIEDGKVIGMVTESDMFRMLVAYLAEGA